MSAKAKMSAELRNMLHDLFVARAAGTAHARMARAHGYVDGYMRALIEAQISSREELLRLVAEERAKVDGPALGYVSYGEASEASA